MRRYYLCPIVGAGTSENPFHAKVADLRSQHPPRFVCECGHVVYVTGCDEDGNLRGLACHCRLCADLARSASVTDVLNTLTGPECPRCARRLRNRTDGDYDWAEIALNARGRPVRDWCVAMIECEDPSAADGDPDCLYLGCDDTMSHEPDDALVRFVAQLGIERHDILRETPNYAPNERLTVGAIITALTRRSGSV